MFAYFLFENYKMVKIYFFISTNTTQGVLEVDFNLNHAVKDVGITARMARKSSSKKIKTISSLEKVCYIQCLNGLQ